MSRKKARVRHEIRGLKFEVEAEALVCGHCGFQMVPRDLVGQHGREVDAAYRRAAGLLSAGEIREARKRLGMSQRDFAEYLGAGVASVKRWELGALPDKSSDNLIRHMTDPKYAKKSLERLCRRLGRKLATAPDRLARRLPPGRGRLGGRQTT